MNEHNRGWAHLPLLISACATVCACAETLIRRELGSPQRRVSNGAWVGIGRERRSTSTCISIVIVCALRIGSSALYPMISLYTSLTSQEPRTDEPRTQC